MAGSPETALITGASSGIGAELARLFARDGSSLVLVARTEERLEALAAELRAAHGVEVRVAPSDLARAGAPRELYERLARDGVQVDVLVNNAGYGMRGPFAELDEAGQMEMIQLNASTPTHLIRLFLPGMLERRRGAVLNVASAAAFQPGPWMAVYYASKAYLLSLSEAIAEEVAGRGVSVSCLAPGPTDTPFAPEARMGESRLFRIAGTMSARAVAEAGYRGMRRGAAVVVPGARTQIIPVGAHLFPRAVMRKLAGFLNQ